MQADPGESSSYAAVRQRQLAALRRRSKSAGPSADNSTAVSDQGSTARKSRLGASMGSSEYPRSSKPVNLGNVLQYRGNAYDSSQKRLSLVEEYISSLGGKLPSFTKNVELLYLSQNSLRSLQGIAKMFPRLRVLSISSNQIEEIDELHELAKCKKLETLSLDQNPVSMIPNYRSHVIAAVPQLQKLDGRDITDTERRDARVHIKKEETMWELMISNARVIEKLNNARTRLAVHDELRDSLRKRHWPLVDQGLFHVQEFLQRSADLPLHQIDDETDRRRILKKLRADVRRSRNRRMTQEQQSVLRGENVVPVGEAAKAFNRPELWDEAFADVMMTQQTRLAALLAELEAVSERPRPQYDEEGLTSMSMLAEHGHHIVRGTGRRHGERLARLTRTADARTVDDPDSGIAHYLHREDQKKRADELGITIRELVDASRADLEDQAAAYEDEIERLQADVVAAHKRSRNFAEKRRALSATQLEDVGVEDGASRNVEQQSSISGAASQTQPLKRRHSSVSFADQVAEAAPIPEDEPIEKNNASGMIRRLDQPASPAPTLASLASSLPPQQEEPLSPTEDGRREREIPQPSQNPRTVREAPRAGGPPLGGRGPRRSRSDAKPAKTAGPGLTRSMLHTPSGKMPVRKSASNVNAGASSQPPQSKRAPPPLSKDLKGPVSDLQRQVELLQSDIEQRVDDSERLQMLNAKLREKLEEYQIQNTENVKEAHTEIQRLSDELQSTQQQNSTLEERLMYATEGIQQQHAEYMEAVTKVQDLEQSVADRDIRISELKEDRERRLELEEQMDAVRTELSRTYADFQQIQSRASAVHQQLSKFEALEEVSDRAVEVHETYIVRRAFQQLRDAVEISKEIRKATERAEDFRSERVKRRVIADWLQYVYQNRMFRAAQRRRAIESASNCFTAWRFFIIRQRTCEQLYDRAQLMKVASSFQQWKEYLDHRRQVRVRYQAMKFVYQRSLVVRTYRAWKEWALHRFDMSTADEQEHTVRALVLNRKLLLQRCLRGWHRWLTDIHRPRCLKIVHSAEFYVIQLRQKAFRAWKAYVAEKRESYTKRRIADYAASHMYVRRTWRAWLSYTSEERRKHVANDLAMRQWAKTTLRHWHNYAMQKVQSRINDRRAARLRRRILLVRMMNGWKDYHDRIQYVQDRSAQALENYFVTLQSRALAKWKHFVAGRKALKEQQAAEDRDRMQTALEMWRRFVFISHHRRHLNVVANNVRRKVDWTLSIRPCFEDWKLAFEHRSKVQAVTASIAERQRMRTLRIAVREWNSFVRRQMRDSLRELALQCRDLQDNMAKQDERMTNVDLENVNLIDKLQAMNEERVRLENALAEQGATADEVQRALEDQLILESTLRSELEKARGELEDKERELRAQQSALEAAMAGNTGALSTEDGLPTAVSDVLEVHVLRQRVADAEAEWQRHQQQAEAYRMTSEQMERQFTKSQEEWQAKLTEALEDASALRTVLQERDAALATVHAALDNEKRGVETAKIQLDNASVGLNNVLEEKDAAAKRMNAEIDRLRRAEMSAFEEVEELKRELMKRDNELKRVRYEVKLLAEREEDTTQRLIDRHSTVSARSNLSNTARSVRFASPASAPSATPIAPPPTTTPMHSFVSAGSTDIHIPAATRSSQDELRSSGIVRDNIPVAPLSTGDLAATDLRSGNGDAAAHQLSYTQAINAQLGNAVKSQVETAMTREELESEAREFEQMQQQLLRSSLAPPQSYSDPPVMSPTTPMLATSRSPKSPATAATSPHAASVHSSVGPSPRTPSQRAPSASFISPAVDDKYSALQDEIRTLRARILKRLESTSVPSPPRQGGVAGNPTASDVVVTGPNSSRAFVNSIRTSSASTIGHMSDSMRNLHTG